MIGFIIKKIIGSKNDREVRRLRPLVGKINEFETSLQSLPEEALREKTAAWKERLSKIEGDAELAAALDEILPEAFAVVKNACRRLCGQEITVRGHPLKWEMIPFDVQLIGGYALHSGRIAEMATGEGKTLVATLPVYLNALSGRGVHVVTVNDYLAARDGEWMGAVYKLLGLTVGCILHDQPPSVRREQYNCDITYGTNAEFGFDYLRDNGMATSKEEQVQRGHYYAIVDEVDSILIDEARTPLIIRGPAVINVDNQYDKFKSQVQSLVHAQEKLCHRFLSEAEGLVRKLRPADGSEPANPQALEREIGLLLYRVKMGQPRSEGLLKLLEDPDNLRLMNKAELELHADQSKKELYAQKEELYFAMDEKSHDADLTEKGRNFLSPKDPNAFVLPDLTTIFHEIDAGPEADARKRLEMKAKIQAEFEARAQQIHCIAQLLKAYCLHQKDVQYVVQENKVIIVDENTGRLMTGRRWSDGLHQAVEAKEGVEIERETQTLATITIQNYFRLYLKLAGMTGTAETEASEFFDIYKLGAGIPEAGGLHVMGTERHESRRIDRQLRGRCARQGDPGSSHFFISLEDDLMRLFGSDRMVKLMEKMGMEEGQELNHPLLNT